MTDRLRFFEQTRLAPDTRPWRKDELVETKFGLCINGRDPKLIDQAAKLLNSQGWTEVAKTTCNYFQNTIGWNFTRFIYVSETTYMYGGHCVNWYILSIQEFRRWLLDNHPTPEAAPQLVCLYRKVVRYSSSRWVYISTRWDRLKG